MSGKQSEKKDVPARQETAKQTAEREAEEQAAVAKVLKQSLEAAFRGGRAGAEAQAINVLALMWLRTIMNYQYRYGGTSIQTFKTLWAEGGVPRFYRGLIPALIQAPISRFGDTAANSGALALLDSYDSTKNLPVSVKTACATLCAAGFRIFLMPIDAWKTTKQVEGKSGMAQLRASVAKHGISRLWHGAGAQVTATAVGHYPWFLTYNWCNKNMPQFEFTYGKYVRQACIGFMAAVISDCCSNSIRVIKTTKQTHKESITYPQAFREVVQKDGYVGLFGRGLKTRIFTNGLQGMLFTVMWKGIQDMRENKRKQLKQ
ncbi:mitochondrial carrier domain-containing protein [Angomonas deanei]|uniref:Mitochondrial carrier protein, putative n=1 Tax=Angomonas deanei TaxID=59799 RepID=A0A7G2C4R6_9TRYP|nr:mitochondrial carrier domain-containing protein [Angomonas deanei]CAD2214609.1 Mitochondrial carrier protein, putative [Angomonas deanei]|eukprot:EPY22422.1 mitochondrial carrier domain-containing protein [Angomonas deanei]